MIDSLRVALCGEEPVQKKEEPQEQTITMTGPLSEVFTKALQIVFAKDDLATLKDTALESQANDAIMAMSILNKQKGVVDNSINNQHVNRIIQGYYPCNFGVYAVPVSSITPELIPTALTSLARDSVPGTEQKNFIVIDIDHIEQSNSSNPTFLNYKPVVTSETIPQHPYAALEAHCRDFGIGLIVGFENLVKELKKPLKD